MAEATPAVPTQVEGYLSKFKNKAAARLKGGPGASEVPNGGSSAPATGATPVAEAAAKASADRFQRAPDEDGKQENGIAWLDMDVSPPLTVFFADGVNPNEEFEDPNPVALQQKAAAEAEAKRQEHEASVKAAADAAKAEKAAAKAAKKAAKAAPAAKKARKGKASEEPAAPAAAEAPAAGTVPASDREVSTKHNGPEIEEKTVFRHVAKIRAAEKVKDEAVSALRKVIKDAKNDGLDTSLLQQVMKEMKENPDILIDRENTKNAMRKVLLVPAFAPLDQEAIGKLTEEQLVAKADLDGQRAGIRGIDVNTNPHDVTTPAGQAWMKGHADSQAKLRDLLGKRLAEGATLA